VVNKATGLEVNARILTVWTCFANRRQDTIPVWTQQMWRSSNAKQ